MDFQEIATMIALVTSLISILGVAFGAGRIVQVVDGLRQAVTELKEVIQAVISDLREVEQMSARTDERLSSHSRRLERLDKEIGE